MPPNPLKANWFHTLWTKFVTVLDSMSENNHKRLRTILFAACCILFIFLVASDGYVHVHAPVTVDFGIGKKPTYRNTQEEVTDPAPTNEAAPIAQAGFGIPDVKTDVSLKIGKPKKEKAITMPKNEAAPISPAQTAKFDAKAYILRYAPLARKNQAKYGVPASIALAQGLIESRAGTSKLAVENNNHFGVKCFSKKCKKGHCSNFTDDTHKDFFRKYPTIWASFNDHAQKLSSGRYAKLLKYGTDYRRWAFGLKAVGYATDRTYAEKLIGVIQRYDLDRYDK